mgnify:CR=1 FL=1
MVEVLYSKCVSVLLTRDSTVRHKIKLEIEQFSELRSRSYKLQLTDPDDLFFLYTKTLTEDDYNM